MDVNHKELWTCYYETDDYEDTKLYEVFVKQYSTLKEVRNLLLQEEDVMDTETGKIFNFGNED